MSDAVHEELLVQMMAGDREAASVLLIWLEPQLVRWFSKRLYIRHDLTKRPEDMSQETLKAVWEELDTFRTPSYPAFRRWVMQIAQNHFRNTIRSLSAEKRRHARQDVDDRGRLLVEFFTRNTKSPGSKLGQKELLELIFAAIDALPEPTPDIIRWRLLENESFATIGKRLNLSATAVQMRLNRGLKLLRTVVGHLGKRERED